MPEPMMRVSTVLGSSGVVLWLERGEGGSCQYDTVGFGSGRVGRIEALSSILLSKLFRLSSVDTNAEDACPMAGPHQDRDYVIMDYQVGSLKTANQVRGCLSIEYVSYSTETETILRANAV